MSYPPQNPESYPQPFPPGGAGQPGPAYPQPGQFPSPGQYQQPGQYPPAGQPTEPMGYDHGFAQPGYEPGYASPPVPPVSGTPGQPFSGPPFSGPPSSGPPAGQPGYGPQPATSGRGRGLTISLAVAAVLLFILGGVMTGLYVAKNGDLEDTRKDRAAQIAQRDERISANESEISTLKKEVDRAKADLADTKQALTGTQNDRDKIEREKQVVAKCLTLFSQSMDAALKGDRAAVNRLSPDLRKTCDEAEKYL